MTTALELATSPINFAAASTGYSVIDGGPGPFTVEADAQCKVAVAFTVTYLFVKVSANQLIGGTTITTRKNGVNGNLSVSIAAGTTGSFEDTSDSDSLVSGDNYNYQTVTGGIGGSITLSFAVVFDNQSTETTVKNELSLSTLSPPEPTDFYGIVQNSILSNNTELNTQYLIRFACSWFQLDVRISSNTLTSASTVNSRINGLNGTQLVSIAAGATGNFVDAIDIDSLSSGALINYQVIIGSTGTSITIQKIQTHFQTIPPNNFFFFMVGNIGGGAISFNFGTTFYFPLEHQLSIVVSVESNVQTKIRGINLNATNLFVIISANSLDGSTTVTTRKNGVNGNLSVSIAAAATGSFEDTIDTDFYSTGDLVNYQMVTGGTLGTLTPSMIAITIIAIPLLTQLLTEQASVIDTVTEPVPLNLTIQAPFIPALPAVPILPLISEIFPPTPENIPLNLTVQSPIQIAPPAVPTLPLMLEMFPPTPENISLNLTVQPPIQIAPNTLLLFSLPPAILDSLIEPIPLELTVNPTSQGPQLLSGVFLPVVPLEERFPLELTVNPIFVPAPFIQVSPFPEQINILDFIPSSLIVSSPSPEIRAKIILILESSILARRSGISLKKGDRSIFGE
jgi:hypothetical protein